MVKPLKSPKRPKKNPREEIVVLQPLLPKKRNLYFWKHTWVVFAVTTASTGQCWSVNSGTKRLLQLCAHLLYRLCTRCWYSCGASAAHSSTLSTMLRRFRWLRHANSMTRMCMLCLILKVVFELTNFASFNARSRHKFSCVSLTEDHLCSSERLITKTAPPIPRCNFMTAHLTWFHLPAGPFARRDLRARIECYGTWRSGGKRSEQCTKSDSANSSPHRFEHPLEVFARFHSFHHYVFCFMEKASQNSAVAGMFKQRLTPPQPGSAIIVLWLSQHLRT